MYLQNGKAKSFLKLTNDFAQNVCYNDNIFY